MQTDFGLTIRSDFRSPNFKLSHKVKRFLEIDLNTNLVFQVSADARGPNAKQRGGPIKRPPQKSQKPNYDDHNNPMTQVHNKI